MQPLNKLVFETSNWELAYATLKAFDTCFTIRHAYPTGFGLHNALVFGVLNDIYREARNICGVDTFVESYDRGEVCWRVGLKCLVCITVRDGECGPLFTVKVLGDRPERSLTFEFTLVLATLSTTGGPQWFKVRLNDGLMSLYGALAVVSLVRGDHEYEASVLWDKMVEFCEPKVVDRPPAVLPKRRK